MNLMKRFFIVNKAVQIKVLKQSAKMKYSLSSVRCLSSAQVAEPQAARDQNTKLSEYWTNTFRDHTTLTKEEWLKVRQDMTEVYHRNERSMDCAVLGAILNSCEVRLQLAKEYLTFVRTKGNKPSIAALGILLKFYKNLNDQRLLSLAEQEEVCQICDEIASDVEVLDSNLRERVIIGLTMTERWRESLMLIESADHFTKPGTGAINYLAVRAFQEADFNLGWQLINKYIRECRNIRSETLVAYIRAISTQKTPDFALNFERFLHFVQEKRVTITFDVADAVFAAAAEYPDTVQAKYAALDYRTGGCRACMQALQPLAVSTEEFTALKEYFLQEVLIRDDVYSRSTPEEVEAFKLFVAHTAPYDVIIDGLNAAYCLAANKHSKNLGPLLADVVRHFVERGQRVLVVGRQHMQGWHKPSMQYISKFANIFLTNDLSVDDPFMLYATLQSGASADYCSRDFMRQHLAALRTDLQDVFRRWQQLHQCIVIRKTKDGKLIVRPPIPYMLSAHSVSGVWHIPCADNLMQLSGCLEVPPTYLCLRLTAENNDRLR